MREKQINKGPKVKRSLPICGDPRCCTSTGIHDQLTHGWGRLDHMGFWEHPCPRTDLHDIQDEQLYEDLRMLDFKEIRES
jgi:hypothetical protein